jgi:hypothetical protein
MKLIYIFIFIVLLIYLGMDHQTPFINDLPYTEKKVDLGEKTYRPYHIQYLPRKTYMKRSIYP